MKDIAEVSCAIVAAVGTAKGEFVEAIRYAKKGNIEEAKKAYEQGVSDFNLGHKAHQELLTEFANGVKIEADVLLVHAECQMMSAEDFKVIAEEVIDFVEEKQA